MPKASSLSLDERRRESRGSHKQLERVMGSCEYPKHWDFSEDRVSEACPLVRRTSSAAQVG